MNNERDAYSVEEFCRRHGISRAYLYLLRRRGEGPRLCRSGAPPDLKEAGADFRKAAEKIPHRLPPDSPRTPSGAARLSVGCSAAPNVEQPDKVRAPRPKH
jgi:hypothetical protein